MYRRLIVCCALLAGVLPAGVAHADGGPIMPLSDVQPGMQCTAYTVIQGTTITSFSAQVIDIVDNPPTGPDILVQVSGPAVARTGVAEGFSGSPVYCPGPGGTIENAGAISATVGQYGNDVALVTPIQQMLGEPVDPPPDTAHLAAKTHPVLGPLTFGGLSPAMLELVQQAGVKGGRQVVGGPSGGGFPEFPDYPVQPLVPGASVAAAYSEGDLQSGAIGTVTYRDGADVYAFGHELDGAGRRSLLLQDAYVYYVVNNPNDPSDGLTTSYKLASPGHTEGTLTSDTPSAVIGQVGSPPTLVPVNVTAHDLDTGATLTLQSQVADESDVGLPLGSSEVDVIAPLEVGEAATQIYDGPPASESGSMCMSITIRESKAALRFCNRYVGTGTPGDSGSSPPELASATASDATSAFTQIERVAFTTLHVTSVDATINAQRGLAAASLVRARHPKTVSPGQRVKVQLVARVYRGPLRTITVHLRIPAHATKRYVVKIRGAPAPATTASNVSNIVGGLTVSLVGGGPSSSGSSLHSIAALRAAIAAISTYDGLRISSHGKPPRPLYRDPKLVISGRLKLTFTVR